MEKRRRLRRTRMEKKEGLEEYGDKKRSLNKNMEIRRRLRRKWRRENGLEECGEEKKAQENKVRRKRA